MEIDKVLMMEDLVSSDDVFFAATGLTNGDLLQGVDYHAGGAITDTLVVRGKTGTVRRIQATHRLDKLSTVSRIPY
jgi:fructose-1,6-bisphosphatase II